jgi:hypothetical protein
MSPRLALNGASSPGKLLSTDIHNALRAFAACAAREFG